MKLGENRWACASLRFQREKIEGGRNCCRREAARCMVRDRSVVVVTTLGHATFIKRIHLSLRLDVSAATVRDDSFASTHVHGERDIRSWVGCCATVAAMQGRTCMFLDSVCGSSGRRHISVNFRSCPSFSLQRWISLSQNKHVIA